MIKAAIIDLDGTLCDASHRLRYINDQSPRDWNSFFEACDKDTCNEWCDELIRGLQSQGFAILFVTGRPEKVRGKTEFWLDWQALTFDKLFMRNDGDFREDQIVKREIYENEIKNKYNIQLVVEDRARVVKMWREIGLTCLQCCEGEY